MITHKIKYYFDRLFIFFFFFPVIIISPFIRREKKRIIFTSFTNKNFNSNSKYLFLWFIENIKDYKCYFVINDKKIRDELNASIGEYFIETNSIAGKIFALRAPVWFRSSAAIPVGGFFLTYKRHIIHLGHGTPLKNIGLLEKRMPLLKRIYYILNRTNVSYTIASSEYFRPIVSKCFGLPLKKVLIAGQPRNDQLFVKSDLDMKQFNKQKNIKNILYAPTWRSSSRVRLFPFEDFSCQELADFLLENNISIFLRTHPGFEDEIDIQFLEIPNVHLFSATTYTEIMDYLNVFDLLITDYSSIYLDYLLLDRPIIFLPYDSVQYDMEVGFTVPYNDFTPGYKPLTIKEFISAISISLNNKDEYKNTRNQVNKICNTIQRENCKNLVKFLYNMNILQ
jgi:CDP-glycerol glycerophosphotransferase